MTGLRRWAVVSAALLVLAGLALLQFLVIAVPSAGPYIGPLLFLMVLSSIWGAVFLITRHRAKLVLTRLRHTHGTSACLVRFAETHTSTWHFGVVVIGVGVVTVHQPGHESRAVVVLDAETRVYRTWWGPLRTYVHIDRPHGVFAIEPFDEHGSPVTEDVRSGLVRALRPGDTVQEN